MSTPDVLDEGGHPVTGRRRWSVFVKPPVGSPDLAHNWAASQREALFFGSLEGAFAFMAVLLARLGATNLQVGLLTALPNLAVFLLAVPFGSFVQGRRNAVPWYARGRAIGQMMIPAIGVAVLVAPGDIVIPLILAIAAIAAIFQAFADLVFWVVMDGVAGPGGRYELLGHRLGLKMGVSAATQAGIGVVLSRVAFPMGYGLVYIASAFTVAGGFRYSRTLRVPDHVPRPEAPRKPLVQRVTGIVREVAAERRFAGFMGIHTLFSFGVRMALPLLPLWYVRELGASDAFIGLIGTVTAALTMVGYFSWRRPARRFGGAWVLVPSTIGVAVFPLLVAGAHTDALVVGLVAVYAFCLAGTDLAVFDVLMQSVPPDRSVRFAALDTGAVNFAGVLAPLTGALVANAWGLAPAMAVSAVIGLTGAALFALVATGKRPSVRRGLLRRRE